ncbi:MAG: NAD-dependent epimerase/dehydratase family protein [Gemmatimonadota bacterium]
MTRALIVGCGFVGAALGRKLLEDGGEVWGVKRDPSGLPPGITPVAADVSDARTLVGSILVEPDVVIYAVSADERTEEAYRAAYVDGLTTVMSVLLEGGHLPDRLLYVSSTAVYGDQGGNWVDEITPTDPTGFRGKVLLDGETVARTGGGTGVPGVSVRLGGIYGPGRTSLIRKVRNGEALCPPGGPYYTNRIHRDDAAGILAHLAGPIFADRSPDGLHDVYLGVDRDPAPYCEVLRWIADELDVPPPETGDDGSLERRRRANKRCRSDRIVEAGYAFRYPSFREGYRELLSGPEASSRVM